MFMFQGDCFIEKNSFLVAIDVDDDGEWETMSSPGRLESTDDIIVNCDVDNTMAENNEAFAPKKLVDVEKSLEAEAHASVQHNEQRSRVDAGLPASDRSPFWTRPLVGRAYEASQQSSRMSRLARGRALRMQRRAEAAIVAVETDTVHDDVSDFLGFCVAALKFTSVPRVPERDCGSSRPFPDARGAHRPTTLVPESGGLGSVDEWEREDAERQAAETIARRASRGYLVGGARTAHDEAVARGPVLIPSHQALSSGARIASASGVAAPPKWCNSGVDVLQLRRLLDASGDIYAVRAFGFHPPSGCETFHWGDVGGFETGEVDLAAGTYAVVLCSGEDYYRALRVGPARLGEAGGHAGLAAEHPVLFAGEVWVGEQGSIVGWTSVSGTYRIPDCYAHQSGSP